MKRYELTPSLLRYAELCRGGPQITRDDEQRLKTFRPKLNALGHYVRMALEYPGARFYA